MVCPRPSSCDMPRALMSMTPNLCCHETEPRSMHSPDTMHYCSLQLQTLLLSAVTSITGCCFCFGSISSFFLELFLHWSPVDIGHLLTWGVHLSVSYFFTFSYCLWSSQGKTTEVVCHSLLQWTTFYQNSSPWSVPLQETLRHSSGSVCEV